MSWGIKKAIELHDRDEAAKALKKKKKWTMFEDVPFPKDGACPNCGHKEFLEGPSGGVSTNVECVKCHFRWNANSLGFDWQYIGSAEDK